MTKTAFVAALAASVLFGASIAEGKGPGGSGPPGAGGFHGDFHNDALTPGVTTPGVDPSPPGWSSPGHREGWQGASTPPGWDNGQREGWRDNLVPPGFDKGDKTGWDAIVNPAPKR